MAESLIPDALRLVGLLDEATALWHEAGAADKGFEDEFVAAALAVHRANFELWHEEDEARNPEATDGRIAGVKRAIDRINQRRNDLVEALDGMLCTKMTQRAESPMHSETPGMMVDRLSILSLKVYHTREETMRESASEVQRRKNCARLAVLMEQRGDLAECLDVLMAQVACGERRFKVYKQMKMYNDPELNPVLYRRGGS